MESRSINNSDAVQSMMYKSLPSLQEMSATKISIALCSSASSIIDKFGKPNFDKDLINVLNVPPRIGQIIKAQMELIEREFGRWLQHLNYNLFYNFPLSYNFNREHFQHCIWKPNGQIDEKKTAQNLCLNSKFSTDHKFGIMCKYCLKDEIDGTSLKELSRNFIDSADFTDCCLLYYWICYKKNELHKIPVEDSVSVDEFMLEQNAVWLTWSSAEYFWDRVDVDNQISLAEYLILGDREILNQLKCLWYKMNDHHRSAILATIPVKIVSTFWNELFEFELAYQIWNQIKQTINREQFAELMSMLSIGTMYSKGYEMSLLLDIWNSAADHLKNYVLFNKMGDIIGFYCTPYSLQRRNLDLLLAMLNYASEERRKHIITTFGEDLAHFNKNSVIIDVIKSYSL